VNERRVVYSSDTGRVRPGEPPSQKATSSAPTRDDGVIRITRERAGRAGKTVTVIRGLPESGRALDARLTELKRLCGAGGTLRDSAIELQGDHRDRVADRLRSQRFKVKLAGG
jgi:translation initiation factor 1